MSKSVAPMKPITPMGFVMIGSFGLLMIRMLRRIFKVEMKSVKKISAGDGFKLQVKISFLLYGLILNRLI